MIVLSQKVLPEEEYPINYKVEWVCNALAREFDLNYSQEQMNMAYPIATSMNEIGMF